MASGLNFKEKFLTCPYNDAHTVEPLRMPRHLIKCRKQYPNVKMSICPFNATHHVREENLPAHIRDCRDKEIVEKDIFIRENPDILSQDLVLQCESPELQGSKSVESWDSEIEDVSSYNSEANIIYKEIPRQPPTGLGKAGRRLWREVDIERIRRLQEGKPIADLVYPTVGGGEISISDIAREYCNNFDLSEFKNYLLERSPRTSLSSLREPKELPELPRPKNFRKPDFASKSSDTESESSCRSSYSPWICVTRNVPKIEEDLEERINAMSISNSQNKNEATHKNGSPDRQRNSSTVVAHRMILRNLRNK